MSLVPESFPIQPGPGRSPKKGEAPVRAFFFDVYGTVCDFYQPLRRAFDALARDKGVACDAGALAIAWRGAYARSTFLAAGFGLPLRPLVEMHRDNLVALVADAFPAAVTGAELDDLVATWNHLDPWPDSVAGLAALKKIAVVAPVSNGNFDDIVALSRHAGFSWDLVLGSSVARAYKPHPDIYLKSCEALRLEPRECCMVAAHQVDLAYAAGHGMQTAFVIRRDEFGGAIKAKGSADIAAAEVDVEGEWTFVARDFVELAALAAG
ncbi:MAG TPA: HAD-IA family hydrolase [Candidatus Binatia bacterium]|jgi:2-haloacid dehalogenase